MPSPRLQFTPRMNFQVPFEVAAFFFLFSYSFLCAGVMCLYLFLIMLALVSNHTGYTKPQHTKSARRAAFVGWVSFPMCRNELPPAIAARLVFRIINLVTQWRTLKSWISRLPSRGTKKNSPPHLLNMQSFKSAFKWFYCGTLRSSCLSIETMTPEHDIKT